MADDKVVQIEPRPEGVPDNTKEQSQMVKDQAAQWEVERTWPIWEVELVGDDVEWVPRADERFWELKDPNDKNSGWVPKATLPDGATLSADGNVVRPHRALIQCRAPSEDYARMLALRDNPACHTVVKAKQIEAS